MTIAEQIALIDARIAAQATSGVESYTITTGGTARTFKYTPLKDLFDARAALVARADRDASGGMRVRTVRFSSTF